MTICQPCKDEADGVVPERGECMYCGREFKLIREGHIPYHKANGKRCQNTMPKGVGHAACEACPCQHRKKGSWNG